MGESSGKTKFEAYRKALKLKIEKENRIKYYTSYP
jgi:hypothetical protein